MKFALFTESFVPNIDGTAITVYNHAKFLRKKGNEVVVVCPWHKRGNTGIEYMDGIKVIRLFSSPIIGYRSYRISVPSIKAMSIAKKEKPDFVHSYNPYVTGVIGKYVSNRLGVPILGSHHVLPQNITASISKLSKFLNKVIGPLSWRGIIKYYNHCDLVTSPSNYGKRILEEKGIKKPVEVLSNGINLKEFKKVNVKKIREKLNIPDNEKVILHTGRLAGERKVDMIVKAAPKILSKEDATFLIVGDGRERKNLEKLCEKLGVSKNFIFTGFLERKDFVKVFQVADLFVHPSDSELQGIVTLEAMANNLPLVVNNEGASSELIIEGKNGFIFKNDNERDLAEKVIRVLNSDTKKMGRVSREIVMQHSLDNCYKKLWEIYLKTIELHNQK